MRWTHLSSNRNPSCIKDLHCNLETLSLLSQQVSLRDVNILYKMMVLVVVVLRMVVVVVRITMVVTMMIFSQQVPLRYINILIKMMVW